MNVEPITLEGRTIRLEPLSFDHHAALCEVAFDDDIWRWTTTMIRTPEDLRAYIETALKWQSEGHALPFAIIEQACGRAVGSTRFGNIERAHRRVEIGWTWIGKNWQRTPVNTEAKYLMLRHAFEMWRCIRVELKTDVLNERSRQAILRIGAKQEGVFRQHMIMPGGRIRDSVYYSIVDTEWPAVRAGLEERLSIPYVPRMTEAG
ncbi:MAG TPA: GNAT family protein [Anaerolineae bacterium]|nr:GNAT family protein [Anaerolineae bacterium]